MNKPKRVLFKSAIIVNPAACPVITGRYMSWLFGTKSEYHDRRVGVIRWFWCKNPNHSSTLNYDSGIDSTWSVIYIIYAVQRTLKTCVRSEEKIYFVSCTDARLTERKTELVTLSVWINYSCKAFPVASSVSYLWCVVLFFTPLKLAWGRR